MGRRHRRTSGRRIRLILSVCAVVLLFALGVIGAQMLEARMAVKVENAGQQLTKHSSAEDAAQVFVNGQWHQKKNIETLLVMGIDDTGAIAGSDSYNNTNQADFLVLFVRDLDSGERQAIHINRDTMADITVLGVTGQAADTIRAQLALAYNYGSGQHDSCRNTADAVSRLLYGVQIDHYITVTMSAVPVMNDWAGGVSVEVMDDMTGVDEALVLGEEITLSGEQALAYVRTRKGLEDSSNINRMKRQRQYASAWVDAAQDKLQDAEAVAQLVMQMSDYHYSDCTAQELADFADALGENPSVPVFELPGEAVKGETFMEFHADDDGIQQLALEMFYAPVK